MNESVTYYLEPGYVYVSGDGVVIRTVVGSCVAVALWDKRKQVGGMNHFIHPKTSNKRKRSTRFGNVALPVLLHLIRQEFNSSLSDIQAQIFGGATPMEFTSKTEGKENIKLAKSYLRKKGICIVSEDIGGFIGRKILFDTATGQAAILKVQQLRRGDWYKRLK